MTALTQDLSIDSKIAHVDEALEPGKAYTIGSEVIRAGYALIQEWDDVSGASKGLRWSIVRNEDYTTAAAHSSGATLTLARKYGEGGDPGEQTVYVQPDDPGAVGAGKLWVQKVPGAGPSVRLQLWCRNDDDDGWLQVGSGDTVLGVVDNNSGLTVYDGDFLSVADLALSEANGTGTIHADIMRSPGGETRANWLQNDNGLSLTVKDDADDVSTRIEMNTTGELQATLDAAPEVPATPTEQDIVDALLALGLVTQAAP